MMTLPTFLIADNDSFPENAYVVHTGNPRFIIDVDSQEYQMLDGSEPNHPAMQNLIGLALEFYENELNKYEDDDYE